MPPFLKNKLPLGAIFVQLHTYCNANCINCPHPFTYGREGIHPKGRMDEKIWRKIIADIQFMEYRNQVGLYLHHEPLLDHSIFKKIKQINQETDAFVVISTNGSLLDQKMRKQLIDACPRIVHININSADKAQYESMTGLCFEKTIEYTKRFIDEAVYKIQVEINCPVLPGVDTEKLVRLFPNTKVNVEFWANSRGGLLQHISSKDKRNRFSFERYCLQPGLNFNILHDGSVILCCNDWMHETKKDFPNLMDSSILEIYWGQMMREIRQEFKKGNYRRYRMCEQCAEEMSFFREESMVLDKESVPISQPVKKCRVDSMNILLGTNHLFAFTGSEITIYTTAKFLAQKGHKVTIYSKYVDPHFIKIFEGIAPVFQETKEISGFPFDVAYIQHHPIAMEIRHCFPKLPIVFGSLGILPFLEQPPILDLNVTFFLALSEEVRDNLINKGVDEKRIRIFRNIVDSSKFFPFRPINQRPQTALVYSYKIDEGKLSIIHEVCDRLKIHCRRIGETPGKINQDELNNYLNQSDLVFTLGRGVIETMMSGRIPIVYDYLGGDGMVTPENIFELMKCNFSGRYYRRNYNVEELINELRKFNPDNAPMLRKLAIELFDADRKINDLVEILKDAKNGFEPGKSIGIDLLPEMVELINTTKLFTQSTCEKKLHPQPMNQPSSYILKGKSQNIPERRLIAFYLPQFHPIPENDQWWGKGFTEWTNVTRARPLFEGHYQPHLPADLGFYDLRLPEVREAQANLAREYGIYGFCYYHYWFKGKRLLERPFEEVLKSKKPDFPFCLCWANENWTRVWDGQNRLVLQKQEYSEADDAHHIRWLIQAFRDERYIRIDGKPLMLIYRPSLLPNPLRTTEIWRSEAKRLGLGDLYLCQVESTLEEHQDPAQRGFDASVEFQPDWTNLGDRLLDHPAYHRHLVYRYEDIVERMLNKGRVPYKRYPCVTPSWDNSARRKSGAVIFIDSTPDKFERWLKEVLQTWSPPSPEENIVFINAWNEWAEGNHLEPDQRYGRKYLEATRRTLWLTGFLPDSISSEALYQECLSLLEQRREEEAISGLEKLLTIDPLHAAAHNDLGVLYYQKNEWDRSRYYLEKATQINPEEIDFKKNLADVYLQSGLYEKALQLYEETLSQDPQDINIILKMSHCCLLLGREEDGAHYIKLASDKDPQNPLVEDYVNNVRGLGASEGNSNAKISREKRTPQISIVMPVCNHLKLLDQSLKSLIQSLSGVSYEIILIDDASTDGSTEFLSQLHNPLVKVIFKQDRVGFIEACRSGAEMASGNYLLFLNQYSEVQPDWIASLLKLAMSTPSCGAVGSKKVLIFEQTKRDEPRISLKGDHQIKFPEKYPSEASSPFWDEFNYCLGSVFLVRKSLWDEIGGFKQRYSPAYYEDTDFLWEIKKKGFNVYYHLYHDHNIKLDLDKPTIGAEDAKTCEIFTIKNEISKKPYGHECGYENKLVSIIIPVYNNLEYTKRCLESLFNFTETPFECIIVDNGSTDGTQDFLKKVKDGVFEIGGNRFWVDEEGNMKVGMSRKKKKKTKLYSERPLFCKRFKVIQNEKNLGFATGNNQGVAEARGDYLLLMNNDVVVTPGWLKRMLSLAEKRPEIGIVGPMTNYISGPQQVEKIDYDPITLSGLNRFARELSEKNRGQSKPFWRVVGFCMLIKRAVVDRIGGLDERFGLGNFEDDDFSFRAKLAGFESWIALDCFVHHFGSRTFEGQKSNYQESLLRNWEIFKRKWGIPQDVPYGSPVDLTQILSQPFSRAKHFYPIHPEEVSISFGEELFQAGDAEGAKQIFNRLLHKDPENVDLLNNLGVIAFQEGETDQAMAYFKQGLDKLPSHPELLENLGQCHLAKGQYHAAQINFEKALGVRPDSLTLLNQLGNCLIQTGEYLKAEEIYTRSFQLDPNQPEVREILFGLKQLNPIEFERRVAL